MKTVLFKIKDFAMQYFFCVLWIKKHIKSIIKA